MLALVGTLSQILAATQKEAAQECDLLSATSRLVPQSTRKQVRKLSWVGR